MYDNSIIIYDRATTRLIEHSNNILFLSEIVNVCNYKINQIIKIKDSKNIITNYLINKLPIEIVKLISEYSDEKLYGEEIKWMLNKSYSILPFECTNCGRLMELNIKIESKCIWHSVVIYKKKNCIKCRQKIY
tara:strand:- start:18720 stop:19118 length:399 start_codon:yes stop_codon:yes gene_type:complete